MLDVKFVSDGWTDYLYWAQVDKSKFKKINKLIADIQRNGNNGLGKPEMLTGNYSGWWSRRVDDKNRLVYRVNGEAVEIVQCCSHYGDK